MVEAERNRYDMFVAGSSTNSNRFTFYLTLLLDFRASLFTKIHSLQLKAQHCYTARVYFNCRVIRKPCVEPFYQNWTRKRHGIESVVIVPPLFLPALFLTINSHKFSEVFYSKTRSVSLLIAFFPVDFRIDAF